MYKITTSEKRSHEFEGECESVYGMLGRKKGKE